MNNKDLLLEIGLEEMPARFVTDASHQLGEKLENWLTENRINFSHVELYSTPRRLAVLVKDVAEKQKDISEEAKGPAKKIALDEEGNWTKAAQGFARGQGVGVDKIYFQEVNGIEYIFINKFIEGKETFSLLQELDTLILNLHFPKNMRWGTNDIRFVRPIKWLLSMFGSQIVPIEITNVKAGNKTLGHRFLGESISVQNPADYKTLLKESYVIANAQERKQMIKEQINNLQAEKGWEVPIDEDLLEEVNNLVEYPTVLFGSFDREYLSLPEEVLVTSMKEHQRYFPVKDKNNQLLPYFVTVRNGDTRNLEVVAHGNEKVLRARLADAQFFFDEDQKMSIPGAVDKLDSIVFHEELGTIGDKIRRVTQIADTLGNMIMVDQPTAASIRRASEISKFDLVTNMVNEFPELQGFMGEKYARLFGEEEEVANAINEHYKPRFAGDTVPSTTVSAVISIADKLDTIVSCFGIGIIPTGSQDPYALRRQATGIVQTLISKNWSIGLESIIGIVMETNSNLIKREDDQLVEELVSFFRLRIKNILQEKQVRYDVIEAVLGREIGVVNTIINKANLLNELANESSFKETVEALSRVTNIAKKANEAEINVALLEEKEEENLHNSFLEMKDKYDRMMNDGEVESALKLLSSLQQPINDYFDNIMVMSDDKKIRQNRLALMKKLANVINSFANFTAIVFK